MRTSELESQLEGVESLLRSWLDQHSSSPRLQESMRYSLLSGGKRFRPLLALAAADVVGTANAYTEAAAASLECIHAYSLIHDDLPAMDDDDLRRGKPTNHIQFDEATAILAGDALQTLAFEGLAFLPPDVRVQKLIAELAFASGASGMVAGQMEDLLAEGQAKRLNLDELQAIHRRKTGALIRASVRMGAISAGASEDQLIALSGYAEALGLAFQIHDDVLDVTSDSETLGKPQGADIDRAKSTYVSVLGLAEAKLCSAQMAEKARAELVGFDSKADYLRSLADYSVQRLS